MSAMPWSHLAFACWYDEDAEPVQSERSGASSDSRASRRPSIWLAEAWMSAAAASRPPKLTFSSPAFMNGFPCFASVVETGSAESAGQLAERRGLGLVVGVVRLLGRPEVRLELVERGDDLAGVLVPAHHHLLERRRTGAAPLCPDAGQLAAQSAELLLQVTACGGHHLCAPSQCLVLLGYLAGHEASLLSIPRSKAILMPSPRSRLPVRTECA